MIERISFDVDGQSVVGNLHLPNGRYPLAHLIVAGPMTSVKEQVTGVYAAALAQHGFAALAIDHRHYGESGGMPRQYEHHGHKREDLIEALSILEQRPDFRAGLLGAVGICLGGGYVADLSMVDNRVRALGLVAGYYRDVEAMRISDPSGYDTRMQQGVEARMRYEISGQLDLVPAVALDGDAAMTTPDTFDYYSRRAAVPNYRNEFAVMSREFFLPFDVQACAGKLQAPIAMIHSEKALSPNWARKFIRSASVAKEELWLESRGQTDFYDNARLVQQSVEWLAPRLKRLLGVAHVM